MNHSNIRHKCDSFSLLIDMFFDRESTVVITKFNKLSESALTTYCQNFGKVIRCFIKNPAQARNKEPCKFDIVR
jgi:hypothetical protein